MKEASGKVRGAQSGNRLAKVGRGWEDLMPRAIGQVTGLYLHHFGAPVRVIGHGRSPSGRAGPIVAFEGPAPLDWTGWYRATDRAGIHCEIDCKRKSVPGPSWSFVSSMGVEQVTRCIDLHKSGCMVGIALLIDEGFLCYGIPWQFLARIRATGRASVTLLELGDALRAGEIFDLRPSGTVIDLRAFVDGLRVIAERG